MERAALVRSPSCSSVACSRYLLSCSSLCRSSVLFHRSSSPAAAGDCSPLFTPATTSLPSPLEQLPPLPFLLLLQDEVAHKLGFEKVFKEFFPECKSKAVLFRHRSTGAKVMSVSNHDENKVFGIVFRTPPKDSTGIPHILEHSVLCGSRKYPLKEPFVELLKGSLHTFLNAFTYPYRTCYPVSQIEGCHN